MTAGWHVQHDVLAAWTAGSTGPAHATSAEQHVVHCAACRDEVAALVRADRPPSLPDLDAVWSRVQDGIEVPAPSRLERLLLRLRLPATDARLIAAAPSLRGAWLVALLLAVLFPAAAAAYSGTRLTGLFLLVAPLVPVAGVAWSYTEHSDAALEQEAATPYSALRLVLLRTVAVLVVSLPLLGTAAAFVPGEVSVAWLLPALGFTAVVLAVSTWTDPLRPAAAVALLWCAAVGRSAVRGDTAVLVSDALLAGYAAAAVVGVLVLVVRTRRLGTLRGNW